MSTSAPHEPSLGLDALGALLIDAEEITDRTTSMSPLKDSRTSRTKKSVLGNPIPVLTIEIGTLLYLPVIVVNPLSEVSLNGAGVLSKWSAMIRALDGDPTATWDLLIRRLVEGNERISTYNSVRDFARLETKMIHATFASTREV